GPRSLGDRLEGAGAHPGSPRAEHGPRRHATGRPAAPADAPRPENGAGPLGSRIEPAPEGIAPGARAIPEAGLRPGPDRSPGQPSAQHSPGGSASLQPWTVGSELERPRHDLQTRRVCDPEHAERPAPRRHSGFRYRSVLRSKAFQTTVAA